MIKIFNDTNFILRSLNNISNSFVNFSFSILAVLMADIGESITIFLVINILVLSLSTTQWERENQKGKSNSFLFDLVIISISIIVQLLFSNFVNFKLSLIQFLLFISFLILNSNFNIFHLSILIKGNIKVTLIGIFLKIICSIAFFCLFYFSKSKSISLFFVLINVFWLAAFMILIFFDGSYQKSFINLNINRESLLINLIEFLRGQFWILVSSSFTSVFLISEIYFFRQILTPVALILASKRSSLFDKAIKNNKPQTNLIVFSKSIYKKVFIISLILISLIIFYDFFISLTLVFWLALIYFQDIRAYYNRTKIITIYNSVIILMLALIPLIILFLLNRMLFPVDLIFNIPAIIVGEIFVIMYFKTLIHDEKYY